MYVLSHGYLLSSYKVFLTSGGCKCLFEVYAFFPWEASCYEYCMLDLCRSISKRLWTSLQVSMLHPRHHSSWTSTLLPFLLGYFFIAGRLCINDVTQQCHITTLCLRPILSLKVLSYYSSSWILSWTVITFSLEQVSSFFSCRRLYRTFPITCKLVVYSH